MDGVHPLSPKDLDDVAVSVRLASSTTCTPIRHMPVWPTVATGYGDIQ